MKMEGRTLSVEFGNSASNPPPNRTSKGDELVQSFLAKKPRRELEVIKITELLNGI